MSKKSKTEFTKNAAYYTKRFFLIAITIPIAAFCGFVIIVFSYLFVADFWAASLEAGVYPNSEQVHDYWRGGSGGGDDFIWYCVSDAIEEVAAFYESYGFVESEYPTRVNYHRGGKVHYNLLARLFTLIGTGKTDYPPSAYLSFWSVTDESTEFEREMCQDNVLIEIGSGYAD